MAFPIEQLPGDLLVNVMGFLDIFSLRHFMNAHPDFKKMATKRMVREALLRYEHSNANDLARLYALICYGCMTFNYEEAFCTRAHKGRNAKTSATEWRCVKCCCGQEETDSGGDVHLMSLEV